MSLNFIQMALLAGSGVAVIAGPLGSLIVWRRLANFGDALGHSALLGICFAFLLNLHLYIGLICISLIMCYLLSLLIRQKHLATDTAVSILSQTALSVGLILATVMETVRIDLLGYLYGDILAVNYQDLLWILGVDIVGVILLVCIWRPLLSITIHAELAKVEGVAVNLITSIFMILVAAVFAIAIKLVGILLITALLVIPASTARIFAKTPEQMAILASVLGVMSVLMGILFSAHWDWPAGPAIVVSAFLLFIFTLFSTRVLRRLIDRSK